MDIKEILFALSSADALGSVREAAELSEKFLSRFCETRRLRGAGAVGFLKGKSDYTILLDAHIDQIGMIVTDVDGDGFLTVSNSGGIDIRALPARTVTVHGKEKIPAVFFFFLPHLSDGKAEYTDISKIKLDTGLKEKARSIISAGDYVTFSAEPLQLVGDTVSGRSFDDRAGAACLLKTAERLSGRELPCNVIILLSDAEELGMRGAVTSAFELEPDEAIAVDVSFGDGPDIPENECGRLGGGAMIGISPVLDRALSDRLASISEENGIKYQTEVMGGKTGTNADVISVSRGGVRTCTVSVPLRNMHTEAETLRLSDLESVCALLEKYVLSGGLMNA